MSDLTDSIINRYLDRNPDDRHAYRNDPSTYHQVDFLRRTLATAERALQRESIPAEVRRRVLETIAFGDPDEARELLLTTFDPTEFRRPSSPVFTEPASGEETSG